MFEDATRGGLSMSWVCSRDLEQLSSENIHNYAAMPLIRSHESSLRGSRHSEAYRWLSYAETCQWGLDLQQ